jgi:outer membrane protein TolC
MLLFLPAAQIATPNPTPPPAAPARGQDPGQAPAQVFDLAGALARARAENAQLKGAKAKVQERQALITSTRADALPQLAVTADYTRLRDDSLLMGGTGQLLASLGMTPSQVAAPYSLYVTQATLSQPLFYWGKLGTAVRVAEMGEREAGYAYTTAELDTLHGVAVAYIAVLSAQAELEVIQTRLQTAERFLHDVEARLEAQTATELDRLRAQSEYLGVLPDNLQAQAAYQRALEQLNGQLALDPRTPLQLRDPGTPELAALAPLVPVERSEVAQYKQQEQMYRANDQIIKSDLRPKLDFNAAYGYQTGASSDLFKEPYDTWKVNLSLRVPLFDGMRTSGKRAQNRAQLEQVLEARVDLERNLAVEQSTAERELRKAVAFQDAAQAAHTAALEALRTSREAFDQGLITSLDLLTAERTERQQESQRKRAELAIWSALFDYRRACGLAPL